MITQTSHVPLRNRPWRAIASRGTSCMISGISVNTAPITPTRMLRALALTERSCAFSSFSSSARRTAWRSAASRAFTSNGGGCDELAEQRDRRSRSVVRELELGDRDRGARRGPSWASALSRPRRERLVEAEAARAEHAGRPRRASAARAIASAQQLREPGLRADAQQLREPRCSR